MNINITNIEKQIAELKNNMNCPNQSYRIGYICALSAVEGLIAKAKQSEKCGNCIYLSSEKRVTGYRCDRPEHFWKSEVTRYKQKCNKACKAFKPKENHDRREV